jgi:hypothetical protein
MKELKERLKPGAASAKPGAELAASDAAEGINPLYRRMIEELFAVDADNMTPLEALSLVSRWKGALSAASLGGAGGKRTAKRAAVERPPPLPSPANEFLHFD